MAPSGSARFCITAGSAAQRHNGVPACHDTVGMWTERFAAANRMLSSDGDAPPDEESTEIRAQGQTCTFHSVVDILRKV